MLLKSSILFLLFFVIVSCDAQRKRCEILLVNIENLDRAGLAKEIAFINSLRPKVFGIDIQFEERRYDENDRKLIKALWESRNLVMTAIVHDLGGEIIFSLGSQSEFAPPFAKTGFVNAFQESDVKGTMKRFKVWDEESVVNGATGSRQIMYQFAVTIALAYDSLKTVGFINSHPQIVDVDYKKRRKFKKYSAKEVLEGSLTKKDIEGKIVMLGFLGPGNEDKFFTPLSRNRKEPDMYGVEYLATIVAQILEE